MKLTSQHIGRTLLFRVLFMLTVTNAECHIEAHYAGCIYAECRYTECCGALQIWRLVLANCRQLLL